jgi:hypothetical protein
VGIGKWFAPSPHAFEPSTDHHYRVAKLSEVPGDDIAEDSVQRVWNYTTVGNGVAGWGRRWAAVVARPELSVAGTIKARSDCFVRIGLECPL